MAKGHKNDKTETTRIKLDAGLWRIYCAECNQAFTSSRSDATYCSGKCRTHAARAPQRLANTLDYLTGLPFHLGRIARQYKHNKRVFAAFKALHSMLGEQLKLFENDAKQEDDQW